MRNCLFVLAIIFAMSGCKEDTPAAPALPVLLDPTDITHESFIMHWEITGTAESFSVDIGTDDIFVDFQTFTGIPGTARSIGINGLESHTEYFYRIRAMNGSVSSPNSSFGSVYTLPVAPEALEATEVSQSGFTARWSSVQDIQIYELDIASDEGFEQILPGFNDREVFGTSFLVGQLESGTEYFYRVRAKGQTTSVSSNIISVTTL